MCLACAFFAFSKCAIILTSQAVYVVFSEQWTVAHYTWAFCTAGVLETSNVRKASSVCTNTRTLFFTTTPSPLVFVTLFDYISSFQRNMLPLSKNLLLCNQLGAQSNFTHLFAENSRWTAWSSISCPCFKYWSNNVPIGVVRSAKNIGIR